MTIITNTLQVKGGRHCNFMTGHMQQHPFIFSDARKYRIRRHLAFWIFWWLFQGFLYSFVATKGTEIYWKRLQLSTVESIFYLFAHIFLSYSLMYFVIPRFLLKQRYLRTAAWTVLLFLVTACLSVIIGAFIIDPLRQTAFEGTFANLGRTIGSNIFLSLLAGLRGAITIGGIAAAIKLMKYWYVKEQRNLQLQKENVESQLQVLRAQVHPHFLFNTLNNIYSFTQHNPPAAGKMVTGLSDLLRYMLYEGNKPLVPLQKELAMVKDYIGLEKIRYGNKLELHIDLPEHAGGLQIAPLLLLPLVENCFKHGTSHMLEHPWVNLQVDIRDNWMRMKLLNGKVNGERQPASDHNGIGIKNVQKRLSLLYPGRHELTITNEEEVFIVNLKIELELKPVTTETFAVKQELTYA